jgi:iron complex transport system ATP-binding protein
LPGSRPAGGPALALGGVGVVRDGRWILRDVDWAVAPGDRWVVVGANGSGKTTLLRIAALYLHPSVGRVDVLGQRLGRVDVRALRRRIGLASGGLTAMLRPQLTAADAVMTARFAALEPWWHQYEPADRDRAVALLERMGVGHAAERELLTLSDGERQRVALARTLMNEPELLLLDEPAAGLDLAAREELVARLAQLADDPTAPPLVLVTHHVEEIPRRFTHAMLLRDGRVVAAGPLSDALTAATLSEAFGLPVRLEQREGRFTAWVSG